MLTVQERDDTKPKHLRRKGIVPIGLVEKGKPTRLVQASTAQVIHALRHTTGARMLELQVEGEAKKRTVIVKQVDHEVITGKILTLTLAEISRTEVLTADVPVHSTGVPQPIEDGVGTLMHQTNSVKLQGKAEDIPASVTVDISGLLMGGHVNAGDLELPQGIELMSSPDATLFSIQPLRAAEEVVEAAEAPAEGEAPAEAPAEEEAPSEEA